MELIRAIPADELHRESAAMESKADRDFNEAYRGLIGRIRKEQPDRADFIIQHLRSSQRAWLKYRDAQAGLVGVYHEIGSASARAAGVTAYSVGLTEARIKEFKEMPNPF